MYDAMFDINSVLIEVGQKMRTFDRDGKEWTGVVTRDREGYLCLTTNYDIRLHPEHIQKYRYEVIGA